MSLEAIQPIFHTEILDRDGIPSDEDFDTLVQFFETVNLRDGMALTLEGARVGGMEVEKYESLVVSRFRTGVELWVGTADGYVFNVTRFIAEARKVVEAYRARK